MPLSGILQSISGAGLDAIERSSNVIFVASSTTFALTLPVWLYLRKLAEKQRILADDTMLTRVFGGMRDMLENGQTTWVLLLASSVYALVLYNKQDKTTVGSRGVQTSANRDQLQPARIAKPQQMMQQKLPQQQQQRSPPPRSPFMEGGNDCDSCAEAEANIRKSNVNFAERNVQYNCRECQERRLDDNWRERNESALEDRKYGRRPFSTLSMPQNPPPQAPKLPLRTAVCPDPPPSVRYNNPPLAVHSPLEDTRENLEWRQRELRRRLKQETRWYAGRKREKLKRNGAHMWCGDDSPCTAALVECKMNIMDMEKKLEEIDRKLANM